MKVLKTMLVVLMIASVSIPLVSCATKASTASESQVTAAVRGNLTVDIVSGGNLELSKKQDLAFEVAGTIAEINVAEGEAVAEGQIIARLDAAPLEDAVETAERAVRTAEIDLEVAQDGEFKIKTAEYDLETATNNFNKLNYPYTWATFNLDVPAAIEAVNTARHQLEEAEAGLEAGPGSENYGAAMDNYRQARNNLATALERLLRGQSIDVFSSTNVSKMTTDYLTARAALIAMQKAQYTLKQTTRTVQTDLDQANLNLEKAKDDLEKARDNLAKAVITAPFAGFITKVNVEGGDEVQKGTIAVQLADPAKFEAKIMVGEKDIFQVKEGGSATVQIDAMPIIVLVAKVAHISPTATIQSGVVNYEVKVEAEAPQSGAISGQVQSPQSFTNRQAGQSTGQTTQLREGLSVTVNIIIAESKNVLMVPNGAITRTGRNVQVQVMKNGVSETRSIKTGISNWQYTEVTEGLTEGEQVVVPKTTSTTTTSSQSQRPFMIPGVPR